MSERIVSYWRREIEEKEKKKKREKKVEEEGIPFSPNPNSGIISATLIWMPSLLVTPDEESIVGGVEE